MRFEQLRQRVERAEHRVTDRVDHAQSSGQSLLPAWRQAWAPGRIVCAGLLSGFLVGRGHPRSRMDGARWLQMASTMSSMFAVLRAAAAVSLSTRSLAEVFRVDIFVPAMEPVLSRTSATSRRAMASAGASPWRRRAPRL